MISKIDLSAVAVTITVGVLWIEHGHRIVIEPTAAAEAPLAAATDACPVNDNVPYSASCLAFLGVDNEPRSRVTAAQTKSAPAAFVAKPHDQGERPSRSPCPDDDKRPYSAACLSFLTGATELGMRWRVTAPEIRATPRADTEQ
jgi:hypothetical protein